MPRSGGGSKGYKLTDSDLDSVPAWVSEALAITSAILLTAADRKK